MGGGLLSKRERICRGTEGSSPSPSSAESAANLTADRPYAPTIEIRRPATGWRDPKRGGCQTQVAAFPPLRADRPYYQPWIALKTGKVRSSEMAWGKRRETRPSLLQLIDGVA